MLKTYLEYEGRRRVGVICSYPSDVVFDSTGRYAFTGALECVKKYQIRQGSVERTYEERSKRRGPLATRLVLHRPTTPGTPPLLAVGYSDGSIKVWNTTTHELVVAFAGHKAEVTALCFNSDATTLVSGAKDSDIIVWDMHGEQSLVRLRGHKNAITEVVVLNATKTIVSASKDRLVKVWDLITQHCVQTIVGFSSEVWSIAVNPTETRLVAVCNDNDLKVYTIRSPDQLQAQQDADADERFIRVDFLGVVPRKTRERGVRIKYLPNGSAIGLQVLGKAIEVFAVHSEDEIKKKRRRRKQREKEKADKKQAKALPGDGSGDVTELPKETEIAATDEISAKSTIKTDAKVISFDFSSEPKARHLIVSLHNNTLVLFKRTKDGAEIHSTVAQAGHRSDIRACALSARDEMLLTTAKDELKVWNVSTGNAIRTIASGYGLCGLFAPGDRHVLIGTKTGAIELYDLHAAQLLQANSDVHAESVFALELKPDKTGFVSASADKNLAFWDFAVETSENGAKTLTIECMKTVEMSDSIFAAKFSRDGKFLAVALLDYSVKVYFADSMKFYLSLYGHKLPVMSLDFSSDSTLLVTGSADKNVKIWGLDFGDCHRSMFAHDDTVMKVAFIPDTHHFFSAGKDGVLKYWDADKFEHIQTLEGHHSEIWTFAMASDGSFLVSGGHDRSLRFWYQTDNPLYIEEQRELEMEQQWEASLLADQAAEERAFDAQENAESANATQVRHKTIESVKEAERIATALDGVNEYLTVKGVDVNAPLPDEFNGKTASEYLLHVIATIRSPILDGALLLLSFPQVLQLLGYLDEWIHTRRDIFLCSRVLFFLLRVHQVPISAARTMRETLESLRIHTRKQLEAYERTMRFNVAAMESMRRLIDDNDSADFFEVSEKLAKIRHTEKTKALKAGKRNYWESSSEDEDAMDTDELSYDSESE